MPLSPWMSAEFVVGALDDDARRPNAGSIYGYDVPIPSIELGDEIPKPSGIDSTGTFPTQGPAVTPTGAAFWHVPSQRLFAVKPGGILVSWRLSGTQGTNNWEASVTWPTNATRYQVHVAGETPVEVSGGGVFTNVVLHATTAGASLTTADTNRLVHRARAG